MSIIQTQRYGAVPIDDDRGIFFPNGILGFPRYKNYVLLQPDAQSVFYWLQSTEAPDLAFVVTDPHAFMPEYVVELHEETRRELGDGQTQTLVIVNRRGNTLTANLQGPLVVNLETRLAAQVVIGGGLYSTRDVIVLVTKKGEAP